MKMEYAYRLPGIGEVVLNERDKKYLDFVTEKQLLSETLWKSFTDVFRTKADDVDLGWRGEYWGKMMRGGCLVYRCTADKRLYAVLKGAVLALLDAAEADGRISTYSRSLECAGWDIWCRKYVLTGMLHFCDICDDNKLVERILDAMELLLERIIERVGTGAGQVPITETSNFWLGVNSCSILEPVLDLYRRRTKERFLAFASYIIETGGCSGGDLIALALNDDILPFQYPENKAYETMSFFEGVLAYYEVTGEEKYLRAVQNFTERVFETDITLIGCAGCTHELFDNSADKQTEYAETIMQETCVTVTWMRLCAKLFLLTGEQKYADRIERSALNALFGSVNLFDQKITMPKSGEVRSPLPFDSYSPLFMNSRGRGIGGLKQFSDGTFYGCCAAIGAAGLAVFPLISSLREPGNKAWELSAYKRNGRIAFTYGPYVLARDSVKENADIRLPVFPKQKDGRLCFTILPPEAGECLRILLETDTGKILLTDYASCGKRWADHGGILSVWLPCER